MVAPGSADKNLPASSGVAFWANLQHVALSMWAGCGLVIVTFFTFKLSYNVEGAGIGLPQAVADSLMIGYGPVVISTFLGFVRVLFNTYVVIGNTTAVALIPIKRGIGFFYVMNFIGVVTAIAILFLLSFHVISAEDSKTWAGLGASIWAATTAVVFGRFFSEYAEEKKALTPP